MMLTCSCSTGRGGTSVVEVFGRAGGGGFRW